MPHRVGLRIAMQQQQRGTIAAAPKANPTAANVNVLERESGKEHATNYDVICGT
jgi:hypothetical protein